MSSLKHICACLVVPGLTALFGIVLFCSPARAQNAGVPVITSFANADIGTDAASWITVQDKEGILHFGSGALMSYDGERWRTTPIPGGYALRGLDFGPDGRLWAAAAGQIGWFARQPRLGWTFHSLRPNISLESAALRGVWHVYSENAGAVFVSEEGVLRWNGKIFTFWPMPGTHRLTAMRVGGTVYVHHVPTGLYAITPDGPQLIIPATVLGDRAVLWMESRPNGWLLATSGGLFTCVRGRLEPFAPVASEFVQRETLTSAARLPDGRLALGTFQGGIALIHPDGTLERILNQDSGLPTRAIYSLFVDREGGLWATSTSHIFRLAVTSPSAFFDQHSGFSTLPARKVIRHEGRIMVATDDGVYELAADETRFQPVEALREHYLDMQPTPSGLLLGGVRAVYRVTKGTSAIILHLLQDAFVLALSRTQPGGVLISAGREIVGLNPGGQARVIVRNMPDIATSVAQDDQGRLWLGTTARGVLLALPDPSSPVEANQIGRTQGLHEFSGPAAVAVTPNGSVLVLSPAGGWIMGRKGARFESIASYPPRRVYDYSVNRDGNVWIVHPASEGRAACVARIVVTGAGATWQPHFVEGLWNVGTPQCILAEPNGNGGTVLWIGGTTGLLRHEVAPEMTPPQPRAPLLRALVRDDEHDAPQPITGALPYSTRSILFEFAAPEFSRRPALRLETYIEGIDPGWVSAGPDSRRELTAVRDGAYTFHVRAVAESGIASAPTSFNFSVLPPWWRTVPALAGALVLLCAVIYGVHRVRVSALRRQNVVLEEKIQERTEQLAQASAAKTQFVANMSHDIRNPLNGIVGLALALEDTRLDTGQRELVATLRECTAYLSTLVDDVLDFASIEAGRVELRPSPFSPAELLRSVAATLRAEADQSGATITVEVAPNISSTLLGDAGRIQQILVNYVTNALKYAGDRICLSARVPDDAPGEIEFAVTDNGPGLSDAEQAVLFNKFTRLPKSGGEHIKGTGLGLAFCRILADIMGGSVGVESRPGHGARFFLRLPLAVCMAQPEIASVPLPQASVLVVEDTDYNAWAAGAVLGKLGLAHVRARTGGEALRLFADRRFNVVLLDRNLPDMDGTEVARRIRELEENGPHAVLVAVTAYCTAEDRALCLDAGMDAFVGKPLTPEKLRKVLSAAGRQLLAAASVHVPSDAHALAVDVSLLSYLSDGTEQGLAAQIERFLAELSEAENQLGKAADSRDGTTLGDAAHRVLSQARLVGCVTLEEAAIALEQAARAHQAGAFDELFSRVRREIATLTAALPRRPQPSRPA